MSNQFCKKLKELDPILFTNQINSCLSNMQKMQNSFISNPLSETVEKFLECHDAILNGYRGCIDNIDTIISALDEMVQADEAPGDDNPPNLSMRELSEKFIREWFATPIKEKEAPMPHNAGCFSNKLKTKFIEKLKPNAHEVVCGKNGSEYHLMVHMSISKDKVLTAFDPYAGGGGEVELSESEWTLLPTAIPKTPIPRWEHQVNTQVLALRADGGAWTTHFFHATVTERPCDRKGQEPRGYLLAYEDGTLAVVPEKYVVPGPYSWNTQ